MYKCILVPTDGSPLSHKAIKKAVQLAKEQKLKLPLADATKKQYDRMV